MIDDTGAAQRDVEQARADLGQTIDALKHKMSAGELFNEMRSQFFPDGGSEAVSKTVSTFSRQVQGNPLALAMIGAGMAWLMFGRGMSASGNGDYDRRPYGDTTSGAYGGYRDAYPAASEGGTYADENVDADATGNYRGRASSGEDNGHGMMHSARETFENSARFARETMHDTTNAASSAMHATGERVSSAYGSARDTIASATSGVGSRASDSARYVRRTSADLMEQYPLAVGAAALAIGAAIGASLPVTRFEEENVGGAMAGVKGSTGSGMDAGRARPGYADLSGSSADVGQSATSGMGGMSDETGRDQDDTSSIGRSI